MLASTRLPSASPALRTLIRRGLRSSAPTSYNFDSLLGSGGGKGPGAGRSIDKWPMSKANTILNIVPQGERHVVERLGKMHDCHESGFFFAIPWIDKVSYIIDMRERAIDITPQAAITKDNVSVDGKARISQMLCSISSNCFVSLSLHPLLSSRPFLFFSAPPPSPQCQGTCTFNSWIP
jgi:hypothetical protein